MLNDERRAAARTLNAVAWCRRLLGVAVVDCLQALLDVYAAVVAVYRCCRIWLPIYTVKKVIDFPVPTLQPECHKLNSHWPGIIKLFLSVGY
jgi:hypothetical protein